MIIKPFIYSLDLKLKKVFKNPLFQEQLTQSIFQTSE